ncbi:MAG: serine/threonine protein kinase, partial [Planctomycetota bacterium]
MSDSISPEDRLLLEELFNRAADLPQAEHAAFLASECPPANTLHIELARLLAGLAGTDIVGKAQVFTTSLVGSQIGPYELLEKIGEGGMGEVYLADQSQPVQRRVALKIIKLGMDSVQVLRRFETERQALARMSHVNVAQVFDGGTASDGRPYFVMEYVPGEPVHNYCDQRKLSTGERIQVFLAICEGVQHAHLRGLIHRDLKPSNLLVMEQDGHAIPKVIDFGIVRATTGRLSDVSLHTMPSQVVGTLNYMSPEQADPTGLDIDTRSDVYSLGVVLYQLLSGLLPFDHSLTSDRPLSDLLSSMREQDPLAPSTRLRRQTDTSTAIAVKHGTDDR